MSKLVFKIYVTGLNAQNRELIASFRSACSDTLTGRQHQVDVIDLLKDSMDAERNKILATPTIMRDHPLPRRRIIGYFRENSKALKALNFLIDDLYQK